MTRYLKTAARLMKDRRGASAAEYAMILAIVGSGIVLASILLGGSIAGSMNDAGTCMSSNGTSCNN
jgi:pilus assembly protein Flp/PilA